MDKPINSTPRDTRGVTEKTRREIFGAIGATALAGVAVASFAKPDAFASVRTAQPDGDAGLLDAVAEFEAAHARQLASNGRYDLPETHFDALTENWYAAIECVIDAPEPTTPAGRAALARTALTAFRDQIGDSDSHSVESAASREETLVLAALAAAAEI